MPQISIAHLSFFFGEQSDLVKAASYIDQNACNKNEQNPKDGKVQLAEIKHLLKDPFFPPDLKPASQALAKLFPDVICSPMSAINLPRELTHTKAIVFTPKEIAFSQFQATELEGAVLAMMQAFQPDTTTVLYANTVAKVKAAHSCLFEKQYPGQLAKIEAKFAPTKSYEHPPEQSEVLIYEGNGLKVWGQIHTMPNQFNSINSNDFQVKLKVQTTPNSIVSYDQRDHDNRTWWRTDVHLFRADHNGFAELAWPRKYTSDAFEIVVRDPNTFEILSKVSFHWPRKH